MSTIPSTILYSNYGLLRFVIFKGWLFGVQDGKIWKGVVSLRCKALSWSVEPCPKTNIVGISLGWMHEWVYQYWCHNAIFCTIILLNLFIMSWKKFGFKFITLNNERIDGFLLLNYLVIWGLKKQMDLWGMYSFVIFGNPFMHSPIRHN